MAPRACANHPDFSRQSDPLCCGLWAAAPLCSRLGLECALERPPPLQFPLFHPTFCKTLHSPSLKPSETGVSLVGGLWPEPRPLQGPSSSPSTKLQPILRGQQKGPSNTRGLEDLKTQVAPEQRPFSHTQSEAAFVSKRRRAWARERSLLAAPGEELVGSEGTFQSLRCIDKLRPAGPVGDLGTRGGCGCWGWGGGWRASKTG